MIELTSLGSGNKVVKKFLSLSHHEAVTDIDNNLLTHNRPDGLVVAQLFFN